MTATSPVSQGRSASPGSSGWQRNPLVSRAPATGSSSPKVTWVTGASALSAIAGVRAASLAPGTLTAARIATPTGVTGVRHG